MSEKNYQTLSAELDDILSKLQDPDVQVDDAINLYEQGVRLASQLEKYLQTAENKLTKLKPKPGK